MDENVKTMESQYGEAPVIDLSKVKNLNASKNTLDKQFAETVKNATKNKSKFCFTEEHEIQLPCGKLYSNEEDELIKNGTVTLRPMSLADEEIIANQSYIKNGSVFKHLLDSCVTNNFDVKKLTPYDTYYLIYALRQITYGEDYKFNITCPECGKVYEKEMSLKDVEFEEIEDSVGVKTFKLPVSKFTVTMRYTQLGDEEAIYRLSKEDAGDTILSYVVRTIEVLDENGEPINPSDYIDFYKALPGRDRSIITESFKKIEDLKLPQISCCCPKCGHDLETEIPFNKEFFRY